jgi:hypothetical protein
MNRARTAIIVAALSLLTLTASAQAGPRSWAVGRGIAPAKGMAVIGINLAGIQKTALYQQALPLLLSAQPQAKAHIDEAKAACGVDLTTMVSDITVVMSDEHSGLILVALRGASPDKLLACANKMAAKHGHAGKISAKKGAKGIVEYTMAGETDKFYAAWVKPDVVAIATDGHNRDQLVNLLGGKGLGGDLAAAVGKVNTGASFWFAVAKQEPVEQMGTMKSAYGSVDLTAGVNVDGHLVMSSAAEAKKVADEATKQMTKNAAQLPPQLANIVKNVKLASAGDEVRIAVTLSQQDLTALLGMVGQMFMGGGGAGQAPTR